MGELIKFKSSSDSKNPSSVDHYFALDFIPFLERLNNTNILLVLQDEDLNNLNKFNNFAKIILFLKKFHINPIIILGQSLLLNSHFNAILNDNIYRNFDPTSFSDLIESIFITKIGRQLQYFFNLNNLKSTLLSGKDFSFVKATRDGASYNLYDIQEMLDLDLYGIPESVDPSFLLEFLKINIVPIISPIASGKGNQAYFCNPVDFAFAISKKINISNIFFTKSFNNFNPENNLLSLTKLKSFLPQVNASQERKLLLESINEIEINKLTQIHLIDSDVHCFLSELCLIENKGILIYNDK